LIDLVLSSGYLAFARHCGFLRAVEESGLQVDGVCGTSSGALVGALWSAGGTAEEIAVELSRQRPRDVMRLRWAFWGGLFSLEPLIERLRDWLPATFEELGRPFGVGVVGPDGAEVIASGPLVEAVAASCAMPYVFAPVRLGARRYVDGGAADRVGLAGWRELRGERDALVHLVERTRGREVPLPEGVPVVRTPRSGASFGSLGDFEGQLEEARGIAEEVVRALTGRG